MDRRHFLGTLGLAAGGIAGGSTRVHVGPYDSWDPAPGTWPLPRYDLRNTASNPHASPPSDPTVTWRATPLDSIDRLVVGPRRVYAAGTVSSIQSVVALDRDSGETAWYTSVLTETMALRGGTLYVAGRERVTALDAETGEREWWTVTEPSLVLGMLVADETLFVAGYTSGLSALDAETGERRWSTERSGSPALVDGELVLTGGDTRRFAPRRVSDVVTSSPPPVAWETDTDSGGPPVAVDGRVVTGNRASGGNFGLRSLDDTTGAVQWKTVRALLNGRPDDHNVVPVLTVLAGRVFAAVTLGSLGRTDAQALVACSLDDGSVAWRTQFEAFLNDVVAAGDFVLAGTGTVREPEKPAGERGAVAGGLRAFDAAGDERWRVPTDAPVGPIAPVGDTVFVGGGAVYAFR